jgi:hypothetical protein
MTIYNGLSRANIRHLASRSKNNHLESYENILGAFDQQSRVIFPLELYLIPVSH